MTASAPGHLGSVCTLPGFATAMTRLLWFFPRATRGASVLSPLLRSSIRRSFHRSMKEQSLSGATTGHQRRALLFLEPPRDSLYSPLCYERLHSGATTGSSKEQCLNTFRWSYRSLEECSPLAWTTREDTLPSPLLRPPTLLGFPTAHQRYILLLFLAPTGKRLYSTLSSEPLGFCQSHRRSTCHRSTLQTLLLQWAPQSLLHHYLSIASSSDHPPLGAPHSLLSR